jgi:hypothetical protein
MSTWKTEKALLAQTTEAQYARFSDSGWDGFGKCLFSTILVVEFENVDGPV